jgi:acyl dehydratase
MSIQTISDVEFGDELAAFQPDSSIANTAAFAKRVNYSGNGRFDDHEKARSQGLPGALVPGIMGMAFLNSLIHSWCPVARVVKIDTVFRAPMLADHPLAIGAVVTDIDEQGGIVELDLTIKNEAGETRVMGTANVRVPV